MTSCLHIIHYNIIHYYGNRFIITVIMLGRVTIKKDELSRKGYNLNVK